MPYRSPCLATRLFLGHPPSIKRPPNASSARRECFRVDLKQIMFCGGFLVLKLYCCFTLFYVRIQSFTVFRHLFKYTSQQRSECLDTIFQTDAFHKTFKLHRMKLMMCCHSCRCVWTRNEASTHITPEMNRHMHAVCVRTLTHTATRMPRASGSFVMHSHSALLSDSCGGLLTPRSLM